MSEELVKEETKEGTPGEKTNTGAEVYAELKSPSCLIAEDSPTIQNYYNVLLPKMGFTLIVADNGQVALDHLEGIKKAGKAFDLIIVDIMMPIMDGVELMGSQDLPDGSAEDTATEAEGMAIEDVMDIGRKNTLFLVSKK